MRILLASLLTSLVTFSAIAQNAPFKDGNQLLEMCETNMTGAIQHVTGVNDGLHASAHHRGVLYCVPDDTNARQAADVVCKYLEQTPEDRHWNSGVIVALALTKAWRCSDK